MEKVRVEKHFLLGYADLYAGEIDPALALKAMPKVAAIELISFLLHLFNVRQRNDHQFQLRHLKRWKTGFPTDGENTVDQFILDNRGLCADPGFKVLDRRPCLNLIQHLLAFAVPDDRSELNAEQHEVLFKCLLHFNTLENEAQKLLFYWEGKGDLAQFVNYILPVNFRNIEHERFKNYVIQFLKVYYFFRFCESEEQYGQYLEAFLRSKRLSSYRVYLWKLMSPFLELLTAAEPTPIMYFDDTLESNFFYEQFRINAVNAVPHQDYQPLRQHPLFESEKNRFVFLDFRFFVDKFYQGFLFDFAETAKLSFSSLKSEMGRLFSEKWLFYTAMDKCFGKGGDVHLSGEALRLKLKKGEPDYYIRVDQEVLLFEFKDVVITVKAKYSGDANVIKQELREKLEKTTDGQQKGITQLLNTIQQIDKGVYQAKAIDPAEPATLTIYPIIVHTDITLESYGVNHYLNERLTDLISRQAATRCTIRPLVMINIDTLIEMQDHFQAGKLELSACIIAYHQYIAGADHVTATFPFDEYIKYYFVQATKERLGNPQDFTDIINSFVREAGH